MHRNECETLDRNDLYILHQGFLGVASLYGEYDEQLRKFIEFSVN